MDANELLSILQEEAMESAVEPWAVPDGQGGMAARFESERVGAVLYLREAKTGRKFAVEVKEV